MATKLSTSIADAHLHVRALYRDMLRCAPYVKKLYGVELPLNEMRDRIRSEFERHPRFQDPAVVDMLVFKGKQELEETLKQWKPKGHLLKYFALEESPSVTVTQLQKESPFLKEFWVGYGKA